MNQEKTVGLYFNPWPVDYSAGPLRNRNPLELYRKAVWFKANPRTRQYMRSLFFERYPNGEFLDANGPDFSESAIHGAQKIMFLYPDATGLGFWKFETRLLGRIRNRSAVCALNGRRREFALAPGVRLRLLALRVAEKLMLGEVAAMLLFVASTPFLLLYDLARGRT